MRFLKDTKWLTLIHLSGILPLFIPAVIIRNKKKDEIIEIDDHYRETIRFQLTILFLFILPGLFVFFEGGGKVMIIAGLAFSIASTLLTMVKVMKGKPYKYFSLVEFKDIKSIIILSLLFLPVAFIHNYFHELGHWLFGKLQGYNMGIDLNGVWLKNGNYNSVLDDVLVGIGGPAFSIVMTLIGLIVIEKYNSIYAYSFVFFPFFSRIFSLSLGEFSAQDEAGISASLEIGTYTVAIIVVSILLLIVLRASYKLRIGFKNNVLIFMTCFISKMIEIKVIELLK